MFDDNGKFNETICDHNKSSFEKNVTKDDKLKLVLINKSLNQSGNIGDIVRIYAIMFENYIP